MKILTLRRASRIISVLLLAGRILMLLGIGAAGIVALTSLVNQWSGRQLSSGALLLGHPFSFGFLAALAASLAVLLGFWFLILTYAQRIFSSMACGNTPFSPHTAVCLRKMALCQLTLCVVEIPLSLWLSMELQKLLANAIKGLFFAFLFFCACLIFQYGCALQQEVDEIL